jgi:hypothetical protein
MRLAALAGVLALTLAIPAAAAGPGSTKADLDGDFVDETINVVDTVDGMTVRVADSCPSGKSVDIKIAGPKAKFGGIDFVDGDRDGGDDVLLDLYSGSRASGDEDLRLVAWRPRSGDPCAEPVNLFRWTGPKERPPYRGARYAGFGAGVEQVSAKFPGWEVVLNELFATKGQPRTKPNVIRQTLYRYVASKQRYVRYLRRVRHLRT